MGAWHRFIFSLPSEQVGGVDAFVTVSSGLAVFSRRVGRARVGAVSVRAATRSCRYAARTHEEGLVRVAVGLPVPPLLVAVHQPEVAAVGVDGGRHLAGLEVETGDACPSRITVSRRVPVGDLRVLVRQPVALAAAPEVALLFLHALCHFLLRSYFGLRGGAPRELGAHGLLVVRELHEFIFIVCIRRPPVSTRVVARVSQ